MAKPPHVLAFELFRNRYGDDKVRLFAAVGLYLESEYKWASTLDDWPTPAACMNYYNHSLPHAADKFDRDANQLVKELADNIVGRESTNLVKVAVDATVEKYDELDHHGWLRGISEAVIGALVWSLILIGISIIAQRVGIDLLETYKRAAGIS